MQFAQQSMECGNKIPELSVDIFQSQIFKNFYLQCILHTKFKIVLVCKLLYMLKNLFDMYFYWWGIKYGGKTYLTACPSTGIKVIIFLTKSVPLDAFLNLVDSTSHLRWRINFPLQSPTYHRISATKGSKCFCPKNWSLLSILTAIVSVQILAWWLDCVKQVYLCPSAF